MAINLTKANATAKKADEIQYTVLEECGTLDTKEYTKKGEEIREELRLRYIQWGNYEPKYDLRWWVISSEGERCGKGVGFTGEALVALGGIIQSLQEEKPKAKKTVACKTKANPTTTKTTKTKAKK